MIRIAGNDRHYWESPYYNVVLADIEFATIGKEFARWKIGKFTLIKKNCCDLASKFPSSSTNCVK